ncbi:MAG: GNAT family N-acetyltransferase [Janthinobacterium lividum]
MPTSATLPTALETPRLVLRPYQPTDAAAFFELIDRSRSRLRESFPDRLRAVRSMADAPVQLANFADDWRSGRFYVFGIWHREDSAYLGDICLMPQPRGQAEIGYYLAAEVEGQGYAREALAALCTFGFESLGAETLLIRCFADNLRGQAVARALGFAAQSLPSATGWRRFRFRRQPEPATTILYFVRTATLAQRGTD